MSKLFKDRLNDFSLCKPDVIKFLQELTRKFKLNHESGVHQEIMNDPSTQYLDACSPIGSPRQKSSLGKYILSDDEEYRAQQRQRIPSPSANIDEKRPFTMDRLVPRASKKNAESGDAAENAVSMSQGAGGGTIASPTSCGSAVSEGGTIVGSKRACKIAPAIALFNQK